MVSLAFHLVFHKIYEIELSEVLATKMSVMRRSIKVSSFELYTVDPFSPHSIKVSSFELYTFDPFSPHSIKVSSFELYTFDHFRLTASKSARLNCTHLTHFHLTAGRFRGNSCIVMFGLLVSCYSLLSTQ